MSKNTGLIYIALIIMSITISGCTSRPQTEITLKNTTNGGNSWVQDAKTTDVRSIIADMTERNAAYINNTGSEYVTGPSKSGNPDEVGIYFRDPTSTHST